MKTYRIIWHSMQTGSEETIAVCRNLREAHRQALLMIGQSVAFDDMRTEYIIDSAYVADENGNPI